MRYWSFAAHSSEPRRAATSLLWMSALKRSAPFINSSRNLPFCRRSVAIGANHGYSGQGKTCLLQILCDAFESGAALGDTIMTGQELVAQHNGHATFGQRAGWFLPLDKVITRRLTRVLFSVGRACAVFYPERQKSEVPEMRCRLLHAHAHSAPDLARRHGDRAGGHGGKIARH